MYVVPATDIATDALLIAEGDVGNILAIKDSPGNPTRTALIAELAQILKGWRLVRDPSPDTTPNPAT